MDIKSDEVKSKIYLKLITEAIVQLSQNKGSLRKDIWDYLYKKYGDSVDYRDFLLAIRDFRSSGKMLNNDGMYSMHSMVLNEVREKTPTPVFFNRFNSDLKKPNMFISFLRTEGR